MSISQHRIDKFMMLVRRCLRQVLFTFVNCDWDKEYLEKFNVVLYKALTLFTLSLRSHLQEIFLEELAKVSVLFYLFNSVTVYKCLLCII